MAIAIALIVLIVASVLFHFVSPWYFTPIASNWGAIDDTISITFWVTGIVYVAIFGSDSVTVLDADLERRCRLHEARDVAADDVAHCVVPIGGLLSALRVEEVRDVAGLAG